MKVRQNSLLKLPGGSLDVNEMQPNAAVTILLVLATIATK